MTSPAGRLLWEFCHEVIESKQAVGTAEPAWFVVNLDQTYLFDLCLLLKEMDYFCTHTIHHGQTGVIAKFQNIFVPQPS
tara:strand:+ start:636 stop:872 length:237 start_codon:yes stop_codon:yes gene_type:complete